MDQSFVVKSALSRFCENADISYLENLNSYSHENGTKMSAMPTFIVMFHLYIGSKVNSSDGILEKPKILDAILNFLAAILEICVASGIFEKTGYFSTYMENVMLAYLSEVFFHLSAGLQLSC